jgi:pyrroloquinoline quinone biosynthesis protein B
MRRAATTLLLLGACAVAPETTEDGAEVVVLGVAQDGGRPQLGCTAACCRELAAGDEGRVASLAVRGDDAWLLVDATPDLPAQVRDMGSLPAAIVLTHAHMGHYLGLAHLGREALGASGMPVWCSERMADYLRGHGPWSQLVELGNIELRVFAEGVAFEAVPGVWVQATAVPHRDEFSDTHAFSLRSRTLRTLYLPDIDRWEGWPLVATVAAHDLVLLDATFHDDGELPGRDMSLIPHPRVPDTMDRLQGLVDGGLTVGFIHLNHSNPLWDPASAEAKAVAARGYLVARRGMGWPERE